MKTWGRGMGTTRGLNLWEVGDSIGQDGVNSLKSALGLVVGEADVRSLCFNAMPWLQFPSPPLLYTLPVKFFGFCRHWVTIPPSLLPAHTEKFLSVHSLVYSLWNIMLPPRRVVGGGRWGWVYISYIELRLHVFLLLSVSVAPGKTKTMKLGKCSHHSRKVRLANNFLFFFTISNFFGELLEL